MASFGETLKHFALSIDLMDTGTCEQFRTVVADHFLNVLKINFYEVQVDGIRVDRRPGLQTVRTGGSNWTNGKPNTTAIRNTDGSYTGQTTFAYDTSTPVWIVAKDRQPLSQTEVYEDLWSGTQLLPRYWAYFNHQMRTSIVIPLKYGDQVFGFLNLESVASLGYSGRAAFELERLADAIAIVLRLHDVTQCNNRNTRAAFAEVQSMLRLQKSSPLSRPKLFLATASRADQRVVGAIHEVLAKFSDIEVHDWSQDRNVGNVNHQIVSAITESRYAICYLSEKAQNGGYVDNPNVIFEAGMLHSLMHSPQSDGRAWIPVREPEPPASPFDLAAERTVLVPRDGEGRLNEPKFKEHLEDAIKKMLDAAP